MDIQGTHPLYKLPNTALQLEFSIVNLEQDVRRLQDHEYYDGIKPDYTIEPSIKEYLANTDKVLEFTKQLIEQSKE